MATMESMRKEIDQMKDFILRQEDEIVRLKKINRLSNEDLSALEGESVVGQRLYDMEMELSEQKRSTTKITKLCMSAINALERIEEKPGHVSVMLCGDLVWYAECLKLPGHQFRNYNFPNFTGKVKII